MENSGGELSLGEVGSWGGGGSKNYGTRAEGLRSQELSLGYRGLGFGDYGSEVLKLRLLGLGLSVLWGLAGVLSTTGTKDPSVQGLWQEASGPYM